MHVSVELPGGLHLLFDTQDTIRSFDPGWTPPSGGHGLALAFDCGDAGRCRRRARRPRRRRAPQPPGAVGRVLGPALRDGARPRRQQRRPVRRAAGVLRTGAETEADRASSRSAPGRRRPGAPGRRSRTAPPPPPAPPRGGPARGPRRDAGSAPAAWARSRTRRGPGAAAAGRTTPPRRRSSPPAPRLAIDAPRRRSADRRRPAPCRASGRCPPAPGRDRAPRRRVSSESADLAAAPQLVERDPLVAERVGRRTEDRRRHARARSGVRRPRVPAGCHDMKATVSGPATDEVVAEPHQVHAPVRHDPPRLAVGRPRPHDRAVDRRGALPVHGPSLPVPDPHAHPRTPAR